MTIHNRFVAWASWLLVTLFYAFQYVIRVSPNVMSDAINSKFGITPDQFGTFASIYYFGYCAAHIPVGLMLDRMSPRIVLALCTVLSVVGLLPLAYADHWTFSILGRMIIGIGSSGAILGIFKIIRLCFSVGRFNTLFGISVFIGLIGASAGGRPVALLLRSLQFEDVILLLNIIGGVMALMMFFICPKHVEDPEERTHSIGSDLLHILKNGRILFLCVMGGLMIGPLEGFSDAWASKFLTNVYHIKGLMAQDITSMIFLGLGIGSPIYTFFVDQTKAYFTILVSSAILMAVGFIYILTGWADAKSLTIVFAGLGVLSMYQCIVIFKSTMCVEERLVGVTSAYANMIIMAFGSVFHSGIGKLMNAFWDQTRIEGTPIFSHMNFIYGLSIIPIAQIIAAVGFAAYGLAEYRKSLKANRF